VVLTVRQAQGEDHESAVALDLVLSLSKDEVHGPALKSL